MIALLIHVAAAGELVHFDAATPLATPSGAPFPALWSGPAVLHATSLGTADGAVLLETVPVVATRLFDANGAIVPWSGACALWTPGLKLRVVIPEAAIRPASEGCPSLPEHAGVVGLPTGARPGTLWLAEGAPLTYADGTEAGVTVARLVFADVPAADGRRCAGWSPADGFATEGPLVLCAPEASVSAKGPPAVYDASEVEVKRRVLPDFPVGVPRDPQRCDAFVDFDATGVPTKVFVSGCPEAFAAETERALAKWRFVPPKVEGERVAGRVWLEVDFDAQ